MAQAFNTDKTEKHLSEPYQKKKLATIKLQSKTSLPFFISEIILVYYLRCLLNFFLRKKMPL